LIFSLCISDNLNDRTACLLSGFLRWNVLLKVELDVTLLEIVIVDTNVARYSCTIVNINDPGGWPFSTPEVLEVKIVTRNLNFHLRPITLRVYCKVCSSFTILCA
jgi:hypothetical protein